MIIIRADGNAKIGAGHLMRCLTVAQAVRELAGRESVCFFCADEQSADTVRQQGFAVTLLGTDPEDPEAELPVWEGAVSEVLAQRGCGADAADPPVILTDSYLVTDDYLRALRRYGRVYLIDDLQKRSFPVDGVINYHPYADRGFYEKAYAGREVSLVLGGKYVPLRQQFSGGTFRVAEQVRNVLITTGGGDQENLAARILEIIREEDKIYHVVVGRFSPHFAKWQEAAKKMQNVRICHDVQDMAELMRSCDLAVTAGGNTVYELSALGVPFICFSYAENQELLTEYIGREKIAGYAGAWHKDADDTAARIGEWYRQLCGDRMMRERFCEEEKKVVDCRGAAAIARELLGSKADLQVK